MNGFSIPEPLPSLVYIGSHGELREKRNRLREAILAGSFEEAKIVAGQYEALVSEVKSGTAGAVWRVQGGPARCSFDVNFEKDMVRDARCGGHAGGMLPPKPPLL